MPAKPTELIYNKLVLRVYTEWELIFEKPLLQIPKPRMHGASI